MSNFRKSILSVSLTPKGCDRSSSLDPKSGPEIVFDDEIMCASPGTFMNYTKKDLFACLVDALSEMTSALASSFAALIKSFMEQNSIFREDCEEKTKFRKQQIHKLKSEDVYRQLKRISWLRDSVVLSEEEFKS